MLAITVVPALNVLLHLNVATPLARMAIFEMLVVTGALE